MDLSKLSVAELQRSLATRELSAEAVARFHIERVQAQEADVQAWEFFDAELVLAQARALDQGPIRGALHGLPLAVKDLFDTADMPTGYGSPIYAGQRPTRDAAVVAAARTAGAIVMGKSVTTEFATFTPGKTRNPRALPALRTPGGSSSGSAAAVAAGMVPFAFGTQTAGSIVRPAAYCGVVGYKPSHNSLPLAGAKILSPSLDTVGVIASDVYAAALLAGTLVRAPGVLVDIRLPLRVGICKTPLFERMSASSRNAMQLAENALRAAGAQVKEVRLPASFEDLNAAQMAIMAYEAANCFTWEHAHCMDGLSPAFKALLETGLQSDLKVFHQSLRVAIAARAEIAACFADFDILLAPSTEGEAPEGLQATGDPVFNRSWSLLGNPCLHLPVATGEAGMPVGVTLVGPLYRDGIVPAAAALLERTLQSAS